MKNLIFTALVSLAIMATTGCTTGNDANTGSKCSASGKCASSGKFSGDKANKLAKKCASSGKCGK